MGATPPPLPPAPVTRPPVGLRMVADPGLRRVDGGRVLIGGAPLRVIRLSDAGATVVDAWLDGRPLADIGAARDLARRLLDAGMVHPEPPVDPAPPPVTVVVPVRDDPDGLELLLATVAEPAVVVDDGSRDAAAVAAVARRHGARLVRRSSAAGPGVARMAGLAETDTAFVAFVDADVELPGGWWSGLSGHFDDDAVAAVAPRVRSRPGPSRLERYESVHSPLDLGTDPGPVGPGRPVAYVPSAALVVRRSAFEAVDGFDPDLRYGEDVDAIWRLVAAGCTVRYEPRVTVTHAPRRSWWAWLAQRRGYGGSAVPLAARHGRAVAPARCSKWSMAAWTAVLLRRPLTGAAIAGVSSAALVPRLSDLPDPVAETARIAGLGHLWAGAGLARAVSRVWWPVLVPLAVVWRRLRPGVLAAMVGPALWGWWTGSRPAGPAASVAMRVADDLAYGVGVWGAVVRHGDARALVPDLGEWPGGREAAADGTLRDA